MSGYSSDVMAERRSRNRDFIPYTRPGREAFLSFACPKCGVSAQQWCKRSFKEKSLPDTPRNRRLMAERTPPSHQERVDLFYLPGKREINERERRKRRTKSAARPGKREREDARTAPVEPSTPSVPDIDAILASGQWPTAEEFAAQPRPWWQTDDMTPQQFRNWRVLAAGIDADSDAPC